MTAAEKLKEVTKIIKQYKKDIRYCAKRDMEFTAGGNGVNSFEAENLICAIYDDVMKIVKAKE